MSWADDAAAHVLEGAAWLDKGGGADCLHLITSTNLYLVASYLYYECDVSLMKDESFDKLCKFLLGSIEDFDEAGIWHQDLFDIEALAAGTGHHLKGGCPMAILQIADVIRMRKGAT